METEKRMRIYMDIPNFKGYLKQQSPNNRDYQLCNSLLKESCVLTLPISKSEFEFLAKLDKRVKNYYAQWSKVATHKSSELINWIGTENTLKKDSFYETIYNKKELSSVFFLDGDVSELTNDGLVAVYSKGNEIPGLKNLMIDSRNIPTQKYYAKKWDNWETVRRNSSPCTDIIIVDQYLFSCDSTNEEETYKNVCELIMSLQKNWDSVTMHPNIILFYNREKASRSAEHWISKIKEIIGDTVKVTIVFLNNEHDRTIITNYKMIDSGDSFSFMRRKVENRHGRWININSLADNNIYALTYDMIEELQTEIDTNKTGIFGDKESKLLYFTKEE